MTAPVRVSSWLSSQARAMPKSVTFTVPSFEKDVPGFHIAVDQTGLMGDRQGSSRLGGDLRGSTWQKGALRFENVSE